MRYLALLRGINLGKHKRLAMTDLRQVLTSLGHCDITTYLQSGNALFSSPRTDRPVMEQEIQQSIERTVALDVPVLIRTPDELASIVAANPFPEAPTTPERYYVSFLSAQPDPISVAAVDHERFQPEQFYVGERAVYLWYPGGAHAARLSNAFWERRFDLTATSRNWTTVTKLLQLSRA